MKLLLIDDEEDLLEIIKIWIADLGLDISTSKSCEEAKHLLRRDKFDIVITDYKLKDGNAEEIIAFSKNFGHDKKTNFIIMSGVIDTEINISYINYKYISKPFTQAYFLAALNTILIPPPPPKVNGIDSDIIETAKKVTEEVLSCFIESGIRSLKVEIEDSRHPIRGELSTLMGFDTEQFKGTILLSYEKPAILSIASGMLFEEFTDITDEVIDVSAEVINILIGNMKGKLDSKYQFKMAAPVVISGKDYSIRYLDGSLNATLPFETNGSKFWVDIRILPQKK